MERGEDVVSHVAEIVLPGPILYFIAFVRSFVVPLASVILIAFINVFYAVSSLMGHWFGARRHVPAESDPVARTG